MSSGRMCNFIRSVEQPIPHQHHQATAAVASLNQSTLLVQDSIVLDGIPRGKFHQVLAPAPEQGIPELGTHCACASGAVCHNKYTIKSVYLPCLGKKMFGGLRKESYLCIGIRDK